MDISKLQYGIHNITIRGRVVCVINYFVGYRKNLNEEKLRLLSSFVYFSLFM